MQKSCREQVLCCRLYFRPRVLLAILYYLITRSGEPMLTNTYLTLCPDMCCLLSREACCANLLLEQLLFFTHVRWLLQFKTLLKSRAGAHKSLDLITMVQGLHVSTKVLIVGFEQGPGAGFSVNQHRKLVFWLTTSTA